MKIRDLIADTIWTPGLDYDVERPVDISVLLPTFRRAQSGLFQKAVESVLNQSHENIELIIIDDASTDGTAAIIEKFMKADGRISCLRHAANIGLPAVSEYEGLIRARGKYIAFAFDDDFFYPDALQELFQSAEASPGCLVYGYVEMHVQEPRSPLKYKMRLGQDADQRSIDGGNFIPNNAVLMPRHIIDHVGFYDPHILMTRQCDWDLWRRVAQYYKLKFVPVAVGEVSGPATNDSLGKTYLIDTWSSETWMRSCRLESLRLENFENYDVFSSPDGLPGLTSDTIQEMASLHAKKRGWKSVEAGPRREENKSVLVISASYDASTALSFDYLKIEDRRRVRVITKDWPISELARASCLVVVRSIENYREWIDCAKLLGIPVFLFVDDNFTELQNEIKILEDWSLDHLRKELKSFAGVLTSTTRLQQYYLEHLLHKNVYLYSPTVHDSGLPHPVGGNEPQEYFTVGIMAGSHRFQSLRSSIIPALNHLAEEVGAIRVVICGISAEQAEIFFADCPDSLEIISVPFVNGWRQAMIGLSNYRPDVVVHPHSDSVNSPYKADTVAVTAWMVNAALVVSDVSPYSEMAKSGNTILVDRYDKPLGWYEAIAGAYHQPDRLESIRAANVQYCSRTYSGEAAGNVITKMLADVDNLSWLLLETRYKSVSWWLSTRNLGLGAQAVPLDMANEVAALRGVLKNSRRFRIFRRNGLGLWPDVSAGFDALKAYVKRLYKNEAMSLELGETIHGGNYAEYAVDLDMAVVDSIDVAFSTVAGADGYVGVEMVSPSGEILRHEICAIGNIGPGGPARFDMSKLAVREQGKHLLRVFAKSTYPVYGYELVKYSIFGFKRKSICPFFCVNYC
ncbi:glycosyltransferase [Chitinolyticbacter albus]|uniref:glycosyltransferase n=1 Tax=Chitinolyticbacter albus TaxID=2961951 RepID=UPI00210DE62F|nr:glycosyltransferase [Chitinolyticbacter albus]